MSGYRYGATGGAAPHEWESSFSTILQRTRSNIDRISSRYGPPEGHLSRPTTSSSLDLGRGRVGGVSHTNPMDYAPVGPGRPHWESENYPPGAAANYGAASKSVEGGIGPAQLEAILDRLTTLEAESASRQGTGGSTVAALEARQRDTDESIASIRGVLDTLGGDIRELQRSSTHVNNQMLRMNTSLEILQADVDSRRSVISKLDGWVRQGEVWRSDIETQLAEINKQLRGLDRTAKDQQEGLFERVTKNDLESLRDRMNVHTQQVVNSSMSSWHEKVESSVRMVERQVAALRLGGSVSGLPSTDNMSDEEITRALNSQQPSELLIKGVISSEVREMEANIEEKVEGRVRAAMRTEVTDAQKIVRIELRDYIGRIAAEVGLVESGEGDTKSGTYMDERGVSGQNSAAARAVAAKKSVESELKQFQDRLEDLAVAVISLQESQTAAENTMRVDMRNVDRKMDDAIAIASAHVSSVQERSVAIDTAVRNYEDAQRKRHFDLREELMEKQKEVSDGWTNERFELDRRILLVEKLVSSAMEHVQASQDSVASFFNSSADMKRLNASAIKVEGLQTEMHAIRADAKAQMVTLAKLEENIARKEDVREIRERVAGVEPLLKQIDDIAATARRVEEENARMRGVLSANDTIVDGLRAETKSVADRINLAESSLFQMRGSITSLAEDTKIASSGASSSVRADMERIKMQQSELAEENMKKDRRIKQCEFDLEDAKDTIQSLQISLKALKNSTPTEAVHELQAKVSGLKAMVDGENAKNTDFSNDLNQVRAQVAELQQAIHTKAVAGELEPSRRRTAYFPADDEDEEAAPTQTRRPTQYFPTAAESSADESTKESQAPAPSRRGTTYFYAHGEDETQPPEVSSNSKYRPVRHIQPVLAAIAGDQQDDSPTDENKSWFGVLSPSASPQVSPKQDVATGEPNRRGTVYFPADPSQDDTVEPNVPKSIANPNAALYEISDSGSESAEHSDGDLEVAHHTSGFDEPEKKKDENTSFSTPDRKAIRRGTEYFDAGNQDSSDESSVNTSDDEHTAISELQGPSPHSSVSSHSNAKRRGIEYFDAQPEFDDIEEVQDGEQDGKGSQVSGGGSEDKRAKRRGTEYFDVTNEFDDDVSLSSSQADIPLSRTAPEVDLAPTEKAKRRGTEYYDATAEFDDEEVQELGTDKDKDSESPDSSKPKRRGTEYFDATAEFDDDAEEITMSPASTSKPKRRGTEYYDPEAEFDDDEIDGDAEVQDSSPAVSPKPSRRGTEYFDAAGFGDEDEGGGVEVQEVGAAQVTEPAVTSQPKRRGTEYFDAEAEFDDGEDEGIDGQGLDAKKGDEPTSIAASASKPKRRGTEYFDAEAEFDDDEDNIPELKGASSSVVATAPPPKRRGTEYFDAEAEFDYEEEGVQELGAAQDTEPTVASQPKRRGTEYFDAETEFDDDKDDNKVGDVEARDDGTGEGNPQRRGTQYFDVSQEFDEDQEPEVEYGIDDVKMEKETEELNKMDDDALTGKLDSLMKGFKTNELDTSSSSSSSEEAEEKEPEFDEDDDDLMMSDPTPSKTKPEEKLKSPVKSHWGDDDVDDIPDIDDIPMMGGDAVMASPGPAPREEKAGHFTTTAKEFDSDSDSDEFDADEAVSNLLHDDTPKISVPAAKPAHSHDDIEDVEVYDPDDALNELINSKPSPISPPKSVPTAVAAPAPVVEENSFAGAGEDSGSDWDSSDSSDEEVTTATSPQKEKKSSSAPHSGSVETSPRAQAATGRDSATSTTSVTSDPNFLNLSVRERLQLRREALKQSRSSMSGSITPTEGT